MKTTKNIIFNSITWYAYAFSLILSLTLFALNFSLYLFACLLPFSFTLSLCHFASPSFPSCLPCASFLSHFLLSCIVFIIFNAFILFCITDYNLHIIFYYFLLFSIIFYYFLVSQSSLILTYSLQNYLTVTYSRYKRSYKNESIHSWTRKWSEEDYRII